MTLNECGSRARKTETKRAREEVLLERIYSFVCGAAVAASPPYIICLESLGAATTTATRGDSSSIIVLRLSAHTELV